MSDVESLSHSGISVSDVREGEEFYKNVMGGRISYRISLNTDDVLRGRGQPHPCMFIGDYLFVVFPHDGTPAEPVVRRGLDGSRHAFAVLRDRFEEVLEHLRRYGVAFEGPVQHPENGPLGESIYFTDSGGNFFEICWRRDEGQNFSPVQLSQG